MKQSLAVLALFLLLMRPLCDVWAAGHGHAEAGKVAQSTAWQDDHGIDSHDDGPCCASVEDGALAKLSEAGAMAIGTHGEAAILAAAWISAAYGGTSLPAARKPSGAPPRVLAYYARSARIQR